MAGSRKKRIGWLDAKGEIAIDEYARRLKSFMKAMADGIVTAGELKEQEARVADLMREVEGKLDDKLHAQVTALLLELTALNIMQSLHSLESARSKVKFRG